MSAADVTNGMASGLSEGSITDPVDRSRRHISTRFLRSELALIFGRRRNRAGMGLGLTPASYPMSRGGSD